MHLILGTKNLKHKAELAVAYGAALRLSEVTTLRFRDISFTGGTVTISEEVSKSRYAGKVELPVRLKKILYQYWKECCQSTRGKHETDNKTIRFPVELIKAIEEAIVNKNVTFSGFVIQACWYALENLEQDQEAQRTNN